jgi:hypothetical protein
MAGLFNPASQASTVAVLPELGNSEPNIEILRVKKAIV